MEVPKLALPPTTTAGGASYYWHIFSISKHAYTAFYDAPQAVRHWASWSMRSDWACAIVCSSSVFSEIKIDIRYTQCHSGYSNWTIHALHGLRWKLGHPRDIRNSNYIWNLDINWYCVERNTIVCLDSKKSPYFKNSVDDPTFKVIFPMQYLLMSELLWQCT